ATFDREPLSQHGGKRAFHKDIGPSQALRAVAPCYLRRPHAARNWSVSKSWFPGGSLPGRLAKQGKEGSTVAFQLSFGRFAPVRCGDARVDRTPRLLDQWPDLRALSSAMKPLRAQGTSRAVTNF